MDGELFTSADYAAKIIGIALVTTQVCIEFHFMETANDVPNAIKDSGHQRRSMNSAFNSGGCNVYIKRGQAVLNSPSH